MAFDSIHQMILDQMLTIDFDKAGRKMVLESFVKAI